MLGCSKAGPVWLVTCVGVKGRQYTGAPEYRCPQG